MRATGAPAWFSPHPSIGRSRGSRSVGIGRRDDNDRKLSRVDQTGGDGSEDGGRDGAATPRADEDGRGVRGSRAVEQRLPVAATGLRRAGLAGDAELLGERRPRLVDALRGRLPDGVQLGGWCSSVATREATRPCRA